jgi:hypothetical protein
MKGGAFVAMREGHFCSPRAGTMAVAKGEGFRGSV